MRTLARAAAGSLALLCAALALVAVAVAAIGIAGTRSAASQGNVIADDELITAVVTGQLARDIDAAYAAGRAAVLTTDEAERARLLGTLYTSLLPAVDARLFALERLHAADPPAERADIALVVRQWTAVRDRLSPPALTSGAAAAGRLTAAYQPVSAHLDGLFRREFDDGQADHRDASAGAARVTGLITGAAALGIVIGLLVLWHGIRRIRRNLEPGQDQAEFAETLQIAGDEDEAHRLLQRHLARRAPSTGSSTSPTPPSTWPSARAATVLS